jgi:hypothetical protein
VAGDFLDMLLGGCVVDLGRDGLGPEVAVAELVEQAFSE